MVNRAEGKENMVVIQDGHAFLCLVLSRLEMFVDDWDPVKTVGREICRQQASHRRQNLASNQALALEVYVEPMPWPSEKGCWLAKRLEDLRIDCLCEHVS